MSTQFKQLADYPPVLTVEQAAELLQYDIGTVYALIRKKVIPVFPMGVRRGKRILKSQLIETIEADIDGEVCRKVFQEEAQV